jgi:accessory gene regulator B
MHISEIVADKIINFIKKYDPDSSSREVLKFDLIPRINALLCILAVLIVCTASGRIVDGFLASLGFIFLRNNSGGIHFKSPNVCNVVSIIFILIAVYLPISFWYYGFILNALSVLLLFVFSPSYNKKLQVTDPRILKRLKMTSILIALSNLLLQSPVLAIAFFIQSLTTMKPVQNLIDKLDI